ncbi:hypothetical protein BDZ89DRAFT_235634 [Hymenopellis radicata]|nr:hypothetical protein BDZ89DRAFT_235634 [Hymenopellis radicata]
MVMSSPSNSLSTDHGRSGSGLHQLGNHINLAQRVTHQTHALPSFPPHFDLDFSPTMVVMLTMAAPSSSPYLRRRREREPSMYGLNTSITFGLVSLDLDLDLHPWSLRTGSLSPLTLSMHK